MAGISIDLVARVDKLEKNMARATKSIERFESRATKATNKLKSFGKALVGFLAARGAVNSLRQTAAELDKLGKTADKLGINVERLQELQFAGEQTGVAVETLNMGLQRFARRLGEAQKGTGEALKAINELGLNAQELAQMPLEDAFFKVGEAIANTANEMNQLALTQKFFDSEGVALLNTLRLGRRGFEELARQIQATGSVMSRSAIKDVETYNDSLNLLSKTYEKVKREITIFLAKPFAAIEDRRQFEKGGIKLAPPPDTKTFLRRAEQDAREADRRNRLTGKGSFFQEKGAPFRTKEQRSAPHAITQLNRRNQAELERDAAKIRGLFQAMNDEFRAFSFTLFNATTSALADTLFDTIINKGKSASDIMRQLALDVGRLLTQLAVRTAITGIGAAIGGPAAAFVGAAPIPAQHGFHGRVNKPTLFLAGENGPEDVDINPLGTRGAGGSGGLHIHLHGVSDASGMMQSLQQKRAEILRMVG